MSQKHISLHSFLVYIMKLSNVIITQHYTTGLLASNKLERMWIELEATETQLRWYSGMLLEQEGKTMKTLWILGLQSKI